MSETFALMLAEEQITLLRQAIAQDQDSIATLKAKNKVLEAGLHRLKQLLRDDPNSDLPFDGAPGPGY